MNRPDQEAEGALLGAILFNHGKDLTDCQKLGLTAQDFISPQHAKLYTALLKMAAAGKPIDTMTAGQESGIDSKTLTDMLIDCPETTHAEEYARQVIEAAAKRRLRDHLTVFLQDCSEGNKPALELLANMQEKAQAEQARLTAGEQEIFPCLRLKDILDYTPPPDHALAGDGWLRRGAGCLLTGGTGLGKSVLAEQIAVSITAGIKILGCIPVHSAYRVLYVQAENDEETLKRDIQAIINNAEGKPCRRLVQTNLCIFHVYGIAGNEFAKWLAEKTQKTRPDLIVIDPYQAYLGGMVDINSSACFLSWIQPVNRIIRDNNCGLLLVAHTPKPKDRETWTARESVYMAAGSSAISNWTRTSAELTAADEETGRYRLRFGKNAERTGLINDQGGIVRDLFIEHSGSIKEPFWRVSDNQAAPIASNYARAIIRLATEQPELSYQEIAKKLGCAKSTVAAWYPKHKNN